MYINGNGDAEGNFTVITLQDDPIIGTTMVPVGYFSFTDRNSVYVSNENIRYKTDLLYVLVVRSSSI